MANAIDECLLNPIWRLSISILLPTPIPMLLRHISLRLACRPGCFVHNIRYFQKIHFCV
jgi:hypothetical protein